MRVVPDSAGGHTVPQSSPHVSFDVFDSMRTGSPKGSISAGRVGHHGFGTELPSGPAGRAATKSLKHAVGGATLHETLPKEANGVPGAHDMISAYREVVGTKTGQVGTTEVGSDRTPSVVDRAKARLESWRTMADRLERVMVEDEQTRLAGVSRRCSPRGVQDDRAATEGDHRDQGGDECTGRNRQESWWYWLWGAGSVS